MVVNQTTLNEALTWSKARLGDPRLTHEFLVSEASPRRFARLKGTFGTSILMVGPDKSENSNWLNLGLKLEFHKLAVPKITHAHLAKGFFLMEDLGSERLDYLCQNATNEDLISVYKATAETLAEWHDRAQTAVGQFNNLNPAYTPKSIKALEWDYFINGLRLLDLPIIIHEGIEIEAEKLCREVAFEHQKHVLIHRDFQSRNVMVTPSGPKIIDWQGARMGPATYDLGSLLWDPYVNLSASVHYECVNAYLKARDLQESSDTFWNDLALSSLMRLMQATGAYAKLSKIDNLPSYEVHIRPALTRMSEITDYLGSLGYPMIYELIEEALIVLGARS
jgi:aminoglycoside/choline kinase family phosphotransferase